MTARGFAGLIAALLVWTLSSLSSIAWAQGDHADCKVTEIEANNSGGGIDPALKPMTKKLKKPPFSGWNTFKLVADHSHEAVPMTTANVSLTTREKLALLYRGSTQARNKKVRLRFSFQLDDKQGKRKADGSFNIDAGDHFIIAANTSDNGAHILAISCVSKP
jgi:hypothetical protein